ncbi:MAG: hypothetical protein IKI30_06185 [Oxalobacter sp.]|nr:hypothetical protein [Oxalobacter sp.]
MKKLLVAVTLASVFITGCGNKKEVKSEQTNQAVASQQITQPSASNNVEGLQGVQGTQAIDNLNNPLNRKWEFVYTVDDEVEVYMDYSSIDKTKHRVWTKIKGIKGDFNGTEGAIYVEGDCRTNETRQLKGYYYKNGNLVEEHPHPRNWEPATDKKSFNGYILDHVCGRVD